MNFYCGVCPLIWYVPLRYLVILLTILTSHPCKISTCKRKCDASSHLPFIISDMHFILYNKYLRYLYLLQVCIVCYIYINIQLYWFLIVNVRVNCVFRCIYYDGICLLSLVICTSFYTINIFDICICYSSLYLQNPRHKSESTAK